MMLMPGVQHIYGKVSFLKIALIIISTQIASSVVKFNCSKTFVLAQLQSRVASNTRGRRFEALPWLYFVLIKAVLAYLSNEFINQIWLFY